MAAKTHRLDRFIAKNLDIGRGEVRLMLAQKRIHVDGILAQDTTQQIDQFSHIELDQLTLQKNYAQYFMLNKPKNTVSATKDDKHQTVIDLLQLENKEQLHIVGRLDFHSTGLLLLTNDSRWSEKLMKPNRKVSKHYTVSLAKAITKEMQGGFQKGIYFPYEGITTAPAELNRIDDFTAEVILTEGKYHQIKRMFGYFDNKVLELKRTQIARLKLDPTLAAGEYRALSPEEISGIFN